MDSPSEIAARLTGGPGAPNAQSYTPYGGQNSPSENNARNTGGPGAPNTQPYSPYGGQDSPSEINAGNTGGPGAPNTQPYSANGGQDSPSETNAGNNGGPGAPAAPTSDLPTGGWPDGSYGSSVALSIPTDGYAVIDSLANAEFGGSGSTTSNGPVILDLTGKGVKITPLSSSNMFFALGANGSKYRTAWAGAGDAVLFYDPNGANAITQADQVIFTDWDPTAKSDMQALKDVFDTNHDGSFDAGDKDWANFKLMVTNADGTTSVETLAQAGITSINLTPTDANVVESDGSAITGVSSYTTTSGTTDEAADVSLIADATGYNVAQTTTQNSDGSTTIDNKAFNAGGGLANETVSTTSANGLSETIAFDNTGDGVFDQTQTTVTVVNADGSSTQTVSDYNAAHVLQDSNVTTTSADGAVVTISRDLDGGGIVQQTETRQTLAGGGSVDTLTNVNPDGSKINQTVTSISADGLTQTTQVDSAGDGAFDQTTVDAIVVNADGSRVETVTTTSNDGALVSQSVTNASANGQQKTIATDSTGDGVVDVTETSAVVNNADGSATTTVTDTNADGSRRSQSVTTLSADGLSKTTATDFVGDGVFDAHVSDVTTLNADGGQTETVTTTSADGALLSSVTTTTAGDGVSRDIATDANGAGSLTSHEIIALQADGSIIDTSSQLNADGSLAARTVTTTSANGLSETSQIDSTGDGTFDAASTVVTFVAAGGDSTKTTTISNGDGSLRSETIAYTSADGLTTSNRTDSTGDGVFDQNATSVTTIDAHGDQTTTTTLDSASGNLLSKTVTTISADRLATIIVTGANGDGATTSNDTIVTASNGVTTNTLQTFAPDGAELSETVSTSSANGLTRTSAVDSTGDGAFDLTTTQGAVLNADGGRTSTSTTSNQNGSTRSETIVTTSANGLDVTTANDSTDDGVFDLTTTDDTVINANGGRTETVTDLNSDGSTRDVKKTTASANGLDTTTTYDLNGEGVVDLTTTDSTVVNADGSRVETIAYANSDRVLDQTVTTTNASATSITGTTQYYGSVNYSTDSTIVVSADGATVNTLETYAGSGVVAETVTTTSANGLSRIVGQGFNGGGVDVTMSDVTSISADGDRVETVAKSSTSALISKTIATTSANGLSRTTQSDSSGDGSFDLTTTDVTTINSDGGTTETVAEINANGSGRESKTTTTSADKKTETVVTDLGVDGRTTETISEGEDGGTTDETESGGSTLTILTSADGLSRTLTYAGALLGADAMTSLTTLADNGARATAFTEIGDDGVDDSISSSVSANGLKLSATLNLQVSTMGEPTLLETILDSDVTSIEANGARSEAIVGQAEIGGVGQSVATLTTSADNLVKSYRLTTAGKSPVTISATLTQATDGAETETISVTSAGGDADIELTGSADRRTFGLQASYAQGDYAETVVLAASGAVSDQSSMQIGGLLLSQTRGQTFNADGGQTVTIADSGGGVGDTTTYTISANGLSTSGQIGYAGGDGVSWTDQTIIQGDGSRVETYTESSSALLVNSQHSYERVVTTSADGRDVTTDIYNYGPGLLSQSDTLKISADGGKTETIVEYNLLGEELSVKTPSGAGSVVTAIQTSADGLVRTIASSGGYSQTTTLLADADGSYVWQGGEGCPSEIASHFIDADGVDTWRYRNSLYDVTVQIDAAAEAAAIGAAAAIYYTVEGAAMPDQTLQSLPLYFKDGLFDPQAFAASLMQSSGSQEGIYSPDLTAQLYYGRAFGVQATASETAAFVAAGSQPLQLAVDIAEAAEFELGGSGLLTSLVGGAPATPTNVGQVANQTADLEYASAAYVRSLSGQLGVLGSLPATAAALTSAPVAQVFGGLFGEATPFSYSVADEQSNSDPSSDDKQFSFYANQGGVTDAGGGANTFNFYGYNDNSGNSYVGDTPAVVWGGAGSTNTYVDEIFDATYPWIIVNIPGLTQQNWSTLSFSKLENAAAAVANGDVGPIIVNPSAGDQYEWSDYGAVLGQDTLFPDDAVYLTLNLSQLQDDSLTADVCSVNTSVNGFNNNQPTLNAVSGGFNVEDSAESVASSYAALSSDANVQGIIISDTAANVVAEESEIAAMPKVGAVIVSDSAANVAANIDALNQDTQVTSVVLTDSGVPTLDFSAAEASTATTDYATLLSKIENRKYDIGVADSAADVVANLSSLYYSNLSAITLTDPGTPTLDVSASDLQAYGSLFSLITNDDYDIDVTGPAADIGAAFPGIVANSHVAAITLTTPGPVSASLTAAQTLDDGAAKALLGGAGLSIALTDADTALSADFAALSANPDITSINLYSTAAENYAAPTLRVNAAEALAGAGLLADDSFAYDVAVTDTVADILANQTALLALPNVTLDVVDTAANVLADAATLPSDAQIASVTVSDSVAIVLANQSALDSDAFIEKIEIVDTAAAIAAAGDTLLSDPKIVGVSSTDGATPTFTETALQAVTGYAVGASTYFVNVVDTAADVSRYIGELIALHAPITDEALKSITLTDSGVPTLTLSAAQAGGDTFALGAIQNPSWRIDVSDTAAHVESVLNLLQGQKHIDEITLTDAGAPVLALSAAVALADQGVIAKIVNADLEVDVSDTAANLVADASALSSDAEIYRIGVVDTVSAIVGDEPLLAALPNFYSITALDTVANILGVGQALAGDATSVTLAVKDTGANVGVAFDELNNSDVSKITLTSKQLNISVAQYFNDFRALREITNSVYSYDLYIQDSAANLEANARALSTTYSQPVRGVVVVDTAANVLTAPAALGNYFYSIQEIVIDSAADVAAHIDALNNLAGLTSIELTDPGVPTLTLTAAQAADDTTALDDIVGPYNLVISGSGVTVAYWVANQTTLDAGGPISISDTSANVSASFSALNADSNIATITLTNTGTPFLALGVGQFLGDTTALSKITNTNVEIAIVDTASAIGAALDDLNVAGVSSITISDDAPVAVTAPQLTSDAVAIDKLANQDGSPVKLEVADPSGNVTPIAPHVVEAGQTTEIGQLVASLAGLSLSLQQTSGATASLSLTATGAVVFKAPASIGASALDPVSYAIADSSGDVVATGSATISLDAGPTTMAGTLKIGPGQSQNITSLLNGLVTPGLAGDIETLTALSATAGSAKLANGVATFVAPANGSSTISFTVTDQLGDTATGGVTATVDPGPATKAAKLTIGHGQSQDITSLLNGLVTPGLAGDVETLTALTATKGTATLANGVATFVAPASGSSTISYTVKDQLGDTASGTVAATVDTGPTLKSQAPSLIAAGRATVVGAATPGLAGDVLTLTTSATGDAAPGQGALSLSGAQVLYVSTGTVPLGGLADSFTYQIADQYGDLSAPVSASVLLDGGPTTSNGTLTVGKSQSGLDETALIQSLFHAGAAGDATAISSVTGATLSKGKVLYTPPTSGSANIGFTVADSLGQTAFGLVTVTVDPGPTTRAGTLMIGHGQSQNVTSLLLGLATPGLSGDALTVTAFTATAGTAKLANGVATFVAPANGSSTISFTVTDQLGDTATGGVTATVDPGPTTKAGKLTIGHGQSQDITSLLNGLVTPGLAGDVETLTALTATKGTATLANGVATFVAPASGSSTISYTVKDQLGDTASGTVAATVDAGPTLKNQAPSLIAAGRATVVGAATPGLAGDVLTLTTSATGDAAPGQGALSLSGAQVLYVSTGTVPLGGLADSFTYQIADQYGDLSAPVSASVLLDGGPTASNGTLTVGKSQSGLDETALIQSLFHAGAAGDATAISSVTGATLSKGKVLYTPPTSGSANIGFTVADSLGQTAFGLVTVTVHS